MSSTLKFCYALTSGSDDTYSDQAFISASVLRRMYPQAHIILLVDSNTDTYLKKSNAPVLPLVNEYICVPTKLSAVAASRFVKTQQRQLITGSYLFIDVDTIPIRPFDDLFQKPITFGAVLDVNPYTYQNPVPSFIDKEFHNLGWEVPEAGWTAPITPYVNSGVMYWSDTPEAHALGREWHKRWREMHEKSDRSIDQPSLFAAINATRIPVTLLDSEYNFILGLDMAFTLSGVREQIKQRREQLRKARIWHFAGKQASTGTLLSELVKRLHRSGAIDWELLDRGIKEVTPFLDPGNHVERNLFMGRTLNAFLLRLTRRG